MVYRLADKPDHTCEIIDMLSVGLATRNRPERLAQWLAHISSIEGGGVLPVIVVDQSTESWNQPLAANVRYIHRPGTGLAIARNVLVSLCQTDYLAVCDDDCLPAHDWLTVAAAVVVSSPTVALWFGAAYPTGSDAQIHLASTPAGTTAWASRPDGNVCLALRIAPQPAQFNAPCAILESLGQGNNMVLHVPTTRRIGGFEPLLGAGAVCQSGEDIEYALRLLCMKQLCGYEPRLIVLHDAWQSPSMAARAGYGYTVGMVALLCWYALTGVTVAAHELAYRAHLRSNIHPNITQLSIDSPSTAHDARWIFTEITAICWGIVLGCWLALLRGASWRNRK